MLWWNLGLISEFHYGHLLRRCVITKVLRHFRVKLSSARTNITFYNNSDGWFLNDYEESPEWVLLATKAVFTGIKYQCCAEVYPDITFHLVFKRQPAFYNYVIILPCFLLSSLTLVLFCLPAETPAKMQLGMLLNSNNQP